LIDRGLANGRAGWRARIPRAATEAPSGPVSSGGTARDRAACAISACPRRCASTSSRTGTRAAGEW